MTTDIPEAPAMPSDPLNLFRLDGKVAVITGGSRGLGAAMAMAFAKAGADVVIASRKLDNCERFAAEVAAVTGRRALPVECHVGRWEECDALAATVEAEFGRCDVLVNNAGMSPLYPSLVEVTEALYDKVMEVNARSVFRLSALFGAMMAAGEGGSIINVSSVAAVQPTPAEAPYGAAKAAVHAFTKSFAREYAPTVRSNCIMPGPFLTDISKAWDLDAFAESARRIIPLQRGGEASEIVGVALFLASEASSYTSGAIIKCDGGMAYPAG